MAAGALLGAALSGCAYLVPAVPLSMQPRDAVSVVSLKTIESTIDKSLQETVSISFIPPQAMAIQAIEYAVDGRVVARDEYDLVLQTAKLQTGDHIVSLLAKSDGTVVRGNTHLLIIESGKVPADADDSAAGPAASTGGAEQPSSASQGSAAKKGGATPKWTGGKTEEKANVSIRIRLPDD
jgi:hypothetical protein